MIRWALLASIVLTALVPKHTQAQGGMAIPPPALPVAEHHGPSWSDGRTRGFVAGSFDLGFLYVRPRLQFGYGKPHNNWAGIELNPTVWFTAIGTYVGTRFAYGIFNLRIGSRFTRPTQRSHLLIQNSYDRPALNRDASGDSRTYISNEAELTLTIPMGRGHLSSESTITYVTRVDDDRYVYEDYLRVIVAPPWIWRQRLTYSLPLGAADAFHLGFVAELVGVPKRDLVALRAGVRISIHASPRVEVRAAWIPAVIHRDTLGVQGGDFGLLGLRYRWATGGVTGS
ncbi:MAG: hypothetical protein AAF411_07980 [Myxococcota bacterium]